MFFQSLPLFVVLLLASVSDIRFRSIPNQVTYLGLLMAFSFALHADWMEVCQNTKQPTETNSIFVEQVENNAETTASSNEFSLRPTLSSADAAAGCLVLTIPLLLLYVCGSIGGGDVKLGACIGAFTGIEAGLSILFFGQVLAGFFALFCIVKNRQSFENSRGIPMAVFYSLGTLIFASGVWL